MIEYYNLSLELRKGVERFIFLEIKHTFFLAELFIKSANGIKLIPQQCFIVLIQTDLIKFGSIQSDSNSFTNYNRRLNQIIKNSFMNSSQCSISWSHLALMSLDPFALNVSFGSHSHMHFQFLL